MELYKLNNIAWIIDESKPAVHPIVFNSNKTKIKLIESGKILPIENDNIYFAAGKALGSDCAMNSGRFFTKYRNSLPLEAKKIITKQFPEFPVVSKDLICVCMDDIICSDKEIVKIAKTFELKLIQNEIEKLNKKCKNLKKYIKGKIKSVASDDLHQSIDF